MVNWRRWKVRWEGGQGTQHERDHDRAAVARRVGNSASVVPSGRVRPWACLPARLALSAACADSASSLSKRGMRADFFPVDFRGPVVRR